MTLLQRYLTFYEQICLRGSVEKANAWKLAQEKAEKYPELLGDLPKLLTTRMLSLQNSASCETNTTQQEASAKQQG